MTTLYKIPVTPGVPDQTITTTLDGRRFRLRLRWNARMSLWGLDILDSTGAPLVTGRVLADGSNPMLGHRYREDVPQGALFAAPNAPTLVSLGREDFLYYAVDE